MQKTGDQLPVPAEKSWKENRFIHLLITLATIAAPFIIVAILINVTLFARDSEAPRIALVVVSILTGVIGIALLVISLDRVVDLLPDRWRTTIRPLVFVGPAVLVLALYKVIPAFNTLYLSFFDERSETWVGFENFQWAFTDPAMLQAFQNNLLWIILVTSFSVFMGLVIAGLTDRVKFESFFKSIIFLPLAISFVGASVIWKFMYAFAPAGRPQIGFLNAIVVALGFDPIGWLVTQPLNTYALIVILIWLQTGFAMVLFSAAIKGVPNELLEAARIDGANEIQIFFRVVVPTISTTIATVTTTILILTLRVFDIVWVMTNGNVGTEVIASRMMKELFRYRNFGRGSAIAVILLLATIPFMYYNIRRFNEEEKLR
ncbi:MAG: sugar ABC transporter permease [Candidatus Promineifilaceae bacterium]|nr:sugar ABC transporter permease [Candidatus Promineifilaceae bacterium]